MWGLALPLLGTGLLNLSSMLGDRFWIGSLGRESLAGLARAHAIWLVALTLILGLGLGTLANVAQRRGADDEAGAARIAGAGLGLALGLGALLCLAAWPLTHLAEALFASEVGPATNYLAIVLMGALFQGPLLVALFALQGAGEGRAALQAGAAAPLLNLVLTPLLLGWGLEGAAAATVLSNLAALAWTIVLVRRKLGVRSSELIPGSEELRAILGVGLPRTLEHAARNGAGLVLVVVLAPFGSSVLAGYAAALAVLLLLIHPGLAIGQATAACVGQALGAARPERAWACAWWGAGSYALFLGVAGLGVFASAPSLIAIFDATPATVRAGSALLRTLAPALPFLGLGLVLGKACAGARRADLSLRAVALAHLGIQLPLVWLLARTWGPSGAFLGMALAYVAHGLMAAAWVALNFNPARPELLRTPS